MQWTLTEEQKDYQELLRSWLAKVANPEAVRGWLDTGDAASFDLRLEQDGWRGVGLAEEHGGQGGGLIELALTAEELGRSSAPSARWLPDVLSAPLGGGVLALPAETLPLTVPELDVDSAGLVTGTVPRVLAGEQAESFLVPVAGGLRRVAASEASMVPRRLLDRSRAAADVSFAAAPSEPVDVPDRFWEDLAARAAVLLAADALGASERMLDLSVTYAGQRHQFGVPIGSFQAVKHTAAEMLVGVEAARSVVLLAAAVVDQAMPDYLMQAAATKAQVTAAAVRAADAALTLHGAIGYTWEHDLHLHYRRAALDAVLLGSVEDWNGLVADGLALV